MPTYCRPFPLNTIFSHADFRHGLRADGKPGLKQRRGERCRSRTHPAGVTKWPMIKVVHFHSFSVGRRPESITSWWQKQKAGANRSLSDLAESSLHITTELERHWRWGDGKHSLFVQPGDSARLPQSFSSNKVYSQPVLIMKSN